MSGVRADWFVEAPADDDDPFEAPVEEVGVPIDLRTEADLFARLHELLRLEGELDGAGIRCAIRERQSSVCSACPVSRAADPAPGLPALCRCGVDQDRVLSTIAVVQERHGH
jgi:hypothetical protein